MKIIGLLALHGICIFYLWLLWKDKNKAIERGIVLTKMGLVSKDEKDNLLIQVIRIRVLLELLKTGQNSYKIAAR
jgi:hypothetical protein